MTDIWNTSNYEFYLLQKFFFLIKLLFLVFSLGEFPHLITKETIAKATVSQDRFIFYKCFAIAVNFSSTTSI